ncbi:MAG: hypothetical protein OEM67_11475 [Thermoleophilia bacterium]|nr:hypothetical protein [Thermoleophilia bacterium]MDH3725754.1 hypothetical protein [Thermoleophilia bacterium]
MTIASQPARRAWRRLRLMLGTDSVWLEGFGADGEVLVGDVNGDLLDDLVNVTGNATDGVLVDPSGGSAFGPAAVWFYQPAPPAI